MIVIDTEVYKDYFLFAAKSVSSGKHITVEMFEGQALDAATIRAVMRKLTISFNGFNYDLPIIAAVLAGFSNKALKALSDEIILSKRQTWQILRDREMRIPAWDHVDLFEVAPGRSSLKIYGGRMHAKKMQDLPIEPSASITPELRKPMREYCVNDLDTTIALFEALRKQIALRKGMSEQYGMDLRSKSDAQIAETIIKSEMTAITGRDYIRPAVDGESFKYDDPGIISFSDAGLKAMFARILKTDFEIGGNGSVIMPSWLVEMPIKIGKGEYRMGIGGLHSSEKRQFVEARGDMLLCDLDVASYYPSIILQQRLSPKHLGEPFLRVYQSIVDRRLVAKRAGDKVTADTLKIAVNGSFGKLGSKYSALYAPELMIQTTMTGQLALLMLIERIEAMGVAVVSANTDGIVCACPVQLEQQMLTAAWDWQLDTTYELERTDYRAVASRDVNNYLAIKTDGEIKGKGVFAQGGLAKNPDCNIVCTAVSQRIANGTPIERTIVECDDIRQFVTIRRVNGGAVWRDNLLGKAVRFYYSTSVGHAETINYVTNGNTVPKSAGAMPVMELPERLPADIDYQLYIIEAEKLLSEVGFA
jgi:DNA polymerase elongation subunit (family B)